MITFDEFKKAEIKIGTILSAEKVPDADRLLRLMVNLGRRISSADLVWYRRALSRPVGSRGQASAGDCEFADAHDSRA